MKQYKIKFIFALFLCFGFVGVTHGSALLVHSGKTVTTAGPGDVTSPSIFDSNTNPDNYFYDEDNSFDEDNSAPICDEQENNQAELFIPAKILTHYFGMYRSSSVLPLYILYCNWKYHIS